MFTINVSSKNDFYSMEHREIGMPLKLKALMSNHNDYIEVLDENGKLLFEATRMSDDIHPKFMIKSYYEFK